MVDRRDRHRTRRCDCYCLRRCIVDASPHADRVPHGQRAGVNAKPLGDFGCNPPALPGRQHAGGTVGRRADAPTANADTKLHDLPVCSEGSAMALPGTQETHEQRRARWDLRCGLCGANNRLILTSHAAAHVSRRPARTSLTSARLASRMEVRHGHCSDIAEISRPERHV
jgi:hypothetical protein